jgi:hypothetical protein
VEEPFPFFLQLLGGGCGGSAAGDEDDPVRLGYSIPGTLEDGAEAATHSIPNHRWSQSLGGDQSETEWFGQIFICEVSEHQKSSLERLSLSADTLEIGSVCDPPAARQFHFPVTGSGNTEESMEVSRGESRLLSVLHGMTLVMNLCPFGNETLTTFLTAAFDEVAPGFGRHTGTKSVLAFAGALRGLIGPFHLFRLKMLPKPKSS